MYAHSADGRAEHEWQGLGEHLRQVGDLAAERAAKFGAADIGRIAGLLHDLGKATAEFQQRLRGANLRVDHATAGARIAADRYVAFGRLVAYAIAGHHAGLANGIQDGPITCLQSRLNPIQHIIPALVPWQQLIELPANPLMPRFTLPADIQNGDGRQGQCLALFVRMLLSALVDADRLDTEAYYALLVNRPIARGEWAPLPLLKERVDAAMIEKARTAATTFVNAERARILAAARTKATLPQGLFSLTVPTGGGKTLASLTFALDHAVEHGLDRVIYVIPFTSIIEQTATVFRDVLGPDLQKNVLEHHSAFRDEEALAALERKLSGQHTSEAAESHLQAGERLRLATENWDSPIVVTTAVQFFESLFSNRPTRCRKLHNITRSVVVLDEAQTLPLNLLRPCVVALDELARNYRTTVLLCTATQPALQAQRANGRPGLIGGFTNVREIVDGADDLYRRLTRVTVAPCRTLTDEALVGELRSHERVLCIVGTRAHARDLYVQLAREPGTYHLSALMCPAHRAQKLAEIKRALTSGACRLLATTVVEAGVDVDFPVVYRAMAGLDSIAQAAGRCNREGNRLREDSIVHLFECEGRKSIPELRQNEEAAREILRHPGLASDPLSPQAVEAYFEHLYWRRTQGRDGLDELGILAALDANAREGWLPFADVAEKFRMIESAMEPVIIPFDDAVRAAIGLLGDPALPPEDIGKVARQLQPYIVNVPKPVLHRLREAGRIEAVNAHRFEDQFLRLGDEAFAQIYRDDLGLDWRDETFRSAESNII